MEHGKKKISFKLVKFCRQKSVPATTFVLTLALGSVNTKTGNFIHSYNAPGAKVNNTATVTVIDIGIYKLVLKCH
jgi:hypothetical protein